MAKFGTSPSAVKFLFLLFDYIKKITFYYLCICIIKILIVILYHKRQTTNFKTDIITTQNPSELFFMSIKKK